MGNPRTDPWVLPSRHPSFLGRKLFFFLILLLLVQLACRLSGFFHLSFPPSVGLFLFLYGACEERPRTPGLPVRRRSLDSPDKAQRVLHHDEGGDDHSGGGFVLVRGEAHFSFFPPLIQKVFEVISPQNESFDGPPRCHNLASSSCSPDGRSLRYIPSPYIRQP